MIAVVDVSVQAQNPQMPLYPMNAYAGSPSSIRIRNVPKKIGEWNITSVQFVVAYPDATIKTAQCKLNGGVWVGTVEGCQTTGTIENGYTIFASGTDENGDVVSNYILGKGDVTILECDGSLTPEDIAYVHLLDGEQEDPRDGDLYPDSTGGYFIWQNGESHALGGMVPSDLDSTLTQFDKAANAGVVGESLDGIADDLNRIDSTLEGLGTRTGNLEGRMTSAEGDIDSLEGDVGTLDGRVDVLESSMSEVETRIPQIESALSGLQDDVDSIDLLVPAQANPSNQLADKNFVNSSVQTATANFRGNWASWNVVPTDASQYPQDYAGSRTPTVNDYLVVQDASGYAQGYDGTWRFKYSGTWATDGKNGWLPEYQVNETPMTAAQLAALNSGITASKVAYYDSTLDGLEELIESI